MISDKQSALPKQCSSCGGGGCGAPCGYGYEMSKSICDDKLKIIQKNGQPKYIRDCGGVLFSFPTVFKYPNQEERYREEIAQAYRLADFLLKSLEQYRESV